MKLFLIYYIILYKYKLSPHASSLIHRYLLHHVLIELSFELSTRYAIYTNFHHQIKTPVYNEEAKTKLSRGKENNLRSGAEPQKQEKQNENPPD